LLFGLILNKLSATKNITQLNFGESAIISEFSNCQVAFKLMAMGFLPGSDVMLVRKSPFGGAYYIKTKNHYVALRNFEAENVLLFNNDALNTPINTCNDTLYVSTNSRKDTLHVSAIKSNTPYTST
jgi:ferrous iron transport protein A